MAERAIGRPWSKEEDEKLREAVKKYGDKDAWKQVASELSGRTNKACRKRWLHSLKGDIKKTAWTPDEDEQLVRLYAIHGTKWSTIARQIKGRTDDACSKRYREALDPNLKKDEWTPEEDARLREVFQSMGGRWKEIGLELQRSSLACRNRWRLLERRQQSSLTQDSAPSSDMQLDGQSQSLSPEEPMYYPYYPPEAYPGMSYSGNFLEITPTLSTTPPEVAPFQFSSSSLSAALSDPPRIHRPLPPETPPNELDTDYPNISSPEPGSSASPSIFRGDSFDEFNDEPMSLDDSQLSQQPLHHFQSPQQLHIPPITVYYECNTPIDQNGSYCMDSPLVLQVSPSMSLVPLGDQLLQDSSPSKSPPLISYHLTSSNNFHHNLPRDQGYYEDFSSASSSPFEGVASLSPTSSPNTASPVDLPGTADQRYPGSLLFSSDVQHSTSTRSRSAHQRPTRTNGESRLSSLLPVNSDQLLRPYACGHASCWPTHEKKSRACFRTSKELCEHNKSQHPDDDGTEKLFRCGLDGCQKSWKSVNGLQYHLQISTDHFQEALSSRFQSSANGDGVDRRGSSGTTSDPGESEQSQRCYPCPHPSCFKTYRHASGLRYHLKHGHPRTLPAQLQVVPPSLERELPARTRKMRPKTALFGGA